MLDLDQRLRDMPVLVQRDDVIDAEYYNLWRRARSRWGTPMRFALSGLKEIALVLSDDYWVCIDCVRFDMPVIAWVDLQNQNRLALHTGIFCHVNYYHYAASAIRARSLEVMAAVLTERLSTR